MADKKVFSELSSWDFDELYKRLKVIEDWGYEPELNAFRGVELAMQRYECFDLSQDEVGGIGIGTRNRDIKIHYYLGEDGNREIVILIHRNDTATKYVRDKTTMQITSQEFHPKKSLERISAEPSEWPFSE